MSDLQKSSSKLTKITSYVCDGVSNHHPTIVNSSIYSDADQRNHQSSKMLAFVRGIHRWPVNSLHKGPVTRKMFPFDEVIITFTSLVTPATNFLAKTENNMNKYKNTEK